MNSKISLLILIAILCGCASFEHGYNMSRARDQYLQVNQAKVNFGYQRVEQIIGFRKDSIKNFVEEKGYPDFLFEYKKDGREGFVFYYLEELKAYDFQEQNWRPTSAKLIEIRQFTEFEKARFGL